MPGSYLLQVRSAVEATSISSPTAFSWFGATTRTLPPQLARAASPGTARSYLTYNLQMRLYNDFYIKGTAQPASNHVSQQALAGITPFVQELIAANRGTGYRQDGWLVEREEEGEVVVSRNGSTLRVPTALCSPPAVPGQVGAQVSIWFPKDLLGISPGYYMAVSNKPLSQADEAQLVRLYWHIRAEGAARLVKLVTNLFNADELPFKLKVINDPRRFQRCDAAVLYISRADYSRAVAHVEHARAAIANEMREPVPALTRKLAPGLGLAEDPEDHESFGLHRCAMLAEGLVRAYEKGKERIEERLQEVVDRLVEAGVDIERPYLRAGSTDTYTYATTPVTAGKDVPKTGAGPVSVLEPGMASGERLGPEKSAGLGWYDPASVGAVEHLWIAEGIAEKIARSAVWHEGRCNWLGAAPHSTGTTVYRALGPDLYAGTAGIALFLAEVYAASKRGDLKHAALGAMKQSLDHVESIPAAERLGLYTGVSGVACAAMRVAECLEDEDLAGAARRLAGGLHTGAESGGHDLLSGSAGAVLALLTLRPLLGASALEPAADLGDKLIAAARKDRFGYSWQAPTFPTRHNLTGFAHGAAGIGHALLGLFTATGAPTYRQAAEMAFAYESSWFDREQSNWADLRSYRGPRARRASISYSTYWCHGA
ncbi:MAG TPA: T3SS effector HopA1 family protein, partial [Chloroflexia bacterium]